MEKDLVDGKIGEVGAYDLEFKEGKLQFKLSVAVKAGGVQLGDAGIHVAISADGVIDAIAKAIPGQWDDAALGLLKGALKA